MKQGKVKELGYGVSIHYNEYTSKFEVYKIGTYFPSDKNVNKDTQVVVSSKTLKKAIKKFKNL